jgi:uncharacterized protein YndB with AHSA1/START domain
MTDDDRLGSVSRRDGTWVLGFERRLDHPPDKVWRALTESDHLQHWFPADLVGERRAGATLELPFWPDHVERYGLDASPLDGRILVWEPPSIFEWTWDVDRLRFELEPTLDGTVLRFTTWLGESDAPAWGSAAGYHVCFDQLEDLLDGGIELALVDRDTTELETLYAQLVEEVAGAT